ncbi:MAG: sugar ABC transporter permease [Anaerolineae bacterium]|nr:sugar ABC transporter permease [Anaerolineae bacterium]
MTNVPDENHAKALEEAAHLQRGRKRRRIREALEAYLFLAPGTLLLLIFNVFPIGYAFYISLFRWRIRKGDFLGFENYLRALGEPKDLLMVVGGLGLLAGAWMLWRKIDASTSTPELLLRLTAAFMLILGGVALVLGFPKMLENGDRDVFNSLLTTFYYAAGTVPLQIVLSFLLATALFRNIKGKSFWRVIYFLPYVTVTVASAAVWQSIFDPTKGLVNIGLLGFGVPEADLPRWLFEAKGVNLVIAEILGLTLPKWAGGPSLALVSVIIYSVWVYVGYNTVIYLSGLGNIPIALYEAADIDGASRWETLRHITIPLVSPTTFFLVMMGVLGTFRAFSHLYVMTRLVGPVGSPQGTTMTASMLIWKHFWEGNRFGYASAVAFILTAVMLSLTWVQNRASEGKVFYG